MLTKIALLVARTPRMTEILSPHTRRCCIGGFAPALPKTWAALSRLEGAISAGTDER
jgi:hypothetical protein